MICPYCKIGIRDESLEDELHFANGVIEDQIGKWSIVTRICSECGKGIFDLGVASHYGAYAYNPPRYRRVWPRENARAVAAEVDERFAGDFREASLILDLSPKASAALSRRCLQAVLRSQGFNQSKLVNQIDAAVPTLPTALGSDLHAVREIGNLAAHETEDRATGEIIDVGPGEAEWNLDVLEELFDHYFVKPVQRAAKKAALNAKLDAAGKQPLK